MPAGAMGFKLGSIDGRLAGTFTLGTSVRTESPDSAVLGTLSTARVGQPPGQLGGNAGGSNLNFEKNRPFSTVLKGFMDLELKRENLGLFVRGKGWYDYELEEGSRAYGNAPNGFRQNVPLSDNGFAREAKFSGLQFADAYAFGKFQPGQSYNLDVRLGRQVVSWGVAQTIPGGINVVNPVDFAALARPGLQPEETRVPNGMLYANLAAPGGWGVDGWYMYEFRANVLNGCGTFFAVAQFTPTGCNYVSVLGGAGVNDPTALESGRFPKRNSDVLPSDGGQWGLSARYRFASLNTELRAYTMNFHSRGAFIGVVNPNIAGAGGGYGANVNARLVDPNGLKYQMVYAEDIKLHGASFDVRPTSALRLFGEYSYRPNQPLQINASDLIAAFLNRVPNSALQLDRGVLALPPGASFNGYDRYGVSLASLGAAHTWQSVAGASRLTLSGEVGWSHVHGLPDPGRLRYGRSDDYGLAQVTGGAPCVDNTAAQKSCATRGFVTSNAWGYRVRLAAIYPGALFGATLAPSLLVGQDVKGNSYGGYFLEDRWLIRPALRAEWRQYFAELQYTRTGGGAYNNQIDRDFVTLFTGFKF
jgi:hypothetical protein